VEKPKPKIAASKLYPAKSIPPQSGIPTVPAFIIAHLLSGNAGIGLKSSAKRGGKLSIDCVP
jgi:hypothetical protein